MSKSGSVPVSGQGKKPFLFKHKVLAKVFRARMLEAITQEGLALPATHPEKWVVNCNHVGTGETALIYLGRYLYRGVIQEKDSDERGTSDSCTPTASG